MQICCQWIFGKRRHSGDLMHESQLIMAILFILLRRWRDYRSLTSKKIKQITIENVCL